MSAPVPRDRDRDAEPMMKMVQHVTLADIAREAGTSASTASRALNGRGYVSAAARDRLLAAADRLGYARLAAGVEQTLREADYQMMVLGDNSESDEEIAGARAFLAIRAPGVIMTPVGSDAADLLTAQGVPVVEVDRRLANGSCDAVVIDNEAGAYQATTHLIELGHRRIALLGIDTDWTTDAGRRAGYRAALADGGIELDESLVVRVAVHAEDAYERIEALLRDRSPTAIFAANNRLAEFAWRVLRGRGLRIPEDVSLVGFDDVPWMEMVEPGITVVAQPTLELGRCAARLLLRRLEAPGLEPAVECLEPALVVRGSTGPAPA
jgi:LacI family transcriptional regulator